MCLPSCGGCLDVAVFDVRLLYLSYLHFFRPDPVPVFYMYPISKLYNVLFAQEYARRYPKVWICSANPGYTESELGTKDAATGEAKGSGGGLPGLQRRWVSMPCPRSYSVILYPSVLAPDFLCSFVYLFFQNHL